MMVERGIVKRTVSAGISAVATCRNVKIKVAGF